MSDITAAWRIILHLKLRASSVSMSYSLAIFSMGADQKYTIAYAAGAPLAVAA
jgi:hypothetical protein